MIKKLEVIRNGINYYKVDVGKNIFIITNSPNEKNLFDYIEELKNHKTNILVRFGEKKYNEDFIRGIDFVDLYIEDGSVPNEETINIFLNIVRKNPVIAVHCVSGLGRAPMMVLIAIILIYKKNRLESIINMRQIIPNSLNTKQINFLKNELKNVDNRNCGINKDCCIIM